MKPRLWILAVVVPVALAVCAASPPQEPNQSGKSLSGNAPQAKESTDPFVIESYATRVIFEHDGTGRRELRVRLRALNADGVARLRQLVFDYNATYEQVELASIEVIRGGAIVKPAYAVQEMPAPVSHEAPAYAGLRQKRVTLLGLQPQDTLTYAVITKIVTPRVLGQFWFEHDFLEEPVARQESLEVNVPRSRTIRLKTQLGDAPRVTDEGERRIYRWEKSSEKSAAGENTDRSRKTSETHPAPAVQLTTFASWDELGRWLAPLLLERAQPSEAIRAKAEELARDRATSGDKIQALYDFVATRIRSVRLPFGAADYALHPAEEVLANRYGDSADKEALLIALAAAIGNPAYPVLVSSSRELDPEIPSPAQFDHVLTVIPLGEEQVWLDPEAEVAPFRMLSASLRGKKALALFPEESVHASAAQLLNTPSEPPFPSTQSVDVEATVSESGALAARVHYLLRGDAELLLRAAFHRTPPSQWNQLGQLLAVSDGFRGEVTQVRAGDPLATLDPYQVDYRISQAKYLDISGKSARPLLPLPTVGLPEASVDAAGNRQPIELGTPLETTTRLELTFPAQYVLRAPVGVAVVRDYAEYRSHYAVLGNRLVAERTVRFRLRELPAARASDYLAFVHAVRADAAQTLELEPRPTVASR